MIVLATFPRSGNTYLHQELNKLLGDKLHFCESHLESFDPSIHNCVKTHDFNLDFEVPPGWVVALQTRNAVDAIPSWFDVEVYFNTVKDTEEDWLEFIPKAKQYYKAFHDKWRSVCLFELDHKVFMADPAPNIVRVAKQVVGSVDLSRWAGPTPPRKASKASNFRYDISGLVNK